jgi:hypothetical protein
MFFQSGAIFVGKIRCRSLNKMGEHLKKRVPLQEKTCFQSKSKFIIEDAFTKHMSITIKQY